jgi:hypothetical protein
VSATWDQVAPSHSHVCAGPWLLPLTAVTRRLLAMYAVRRPGGSAATGPVSATCVQAAPSHSQVWGPSSTAWATSFERAASQASTTLVIGPMSSSCSHVVPSHRQVSWKTVPLWPPPYRSTYFWLGSYAIAAAIRGDGPTSSRCVHRTRGMTDLPSHRRPLAGI